MKKLLLFSICFSGLVGAQTYGNANTFPIPDNSVAGIQSDIPVALVKTITDPAKVTVSLDLAHTWSGDIAVALVLPGSTGLGPTALIKRLGSIAPDSFGSGRDFQAGNILSFNSAATDFIIPPAEGFIAAGTYLPTVGLNTTPAEYTVADLTSMFNNLAVNGTWSLRVFDRSSGDVGTLNNWKIVFAAGAFLGVDTTITSTPGLTVMGNPFRETLNLKVNTAANDVKFDIYSIDGKKIYSYQKSALNNSSGDLQIPTQNWSIGSYVLVPTVNGEKLMSIKLLKK